MGDTPITTNPALIDNVLAEFQTKLEAELSWLDYSCGKVVEMKIDDKPLPMIYVGDNRYKNVMPDQTLGNHCFFDIDNTYNFAEWHKGKHSLIRATYGLVFWFDLSKIYPDSLTRDVEAVKQEILEVLSEKISLLTGSYTLESVQEGARLVFAKYAQPGYDEKYLLHPFAAIRVNGQLTFTSR